MTTNPNHSITIKITTSRDFPTLYKFIQNKKLARKNITIDLSALNEITTSGVNLIVMFVHYHKVLESIIHLIDPKKK